MDRSLLLFESRVYHVECIFPADIVVDSEVIKVSSSYFFPVFGLPPIFSYFFMKFLVVPFFGGEGGFARYTETFLKYLKKNCQQERSFRSYNHTLKFTSFSPSTTATTWCPFQSSP